MQLFPHQQKALEDTQQFNRVAYYLDMGLGKTFVGSEKAFSFPERIVLVCQKSKIDDWLEHFRKYYPCTPFNLTNKRQLEEFTGTVGKCVGVINYDLVFRRSYFAHKEALSNAWEAVTNVFETIKNVIQTAFMFIGSIISAAFDIITLPFRFIWENCKDTIMKVWEAIKNTVETAINAVKSVIETVMTAISNFIKPILDKIKGFFETVWNAIVNFITPILNTIKTIISNAFTAVKTTVSHVLNTVKQTVMNIFNGIKSTISNILNSVKSTVSNVFNAVKTSIEKPINAAKDIVKKGLDAIKGFFSGLQLKFPNIKLPHFKVEGKLSISPPSVPKLSIQWYKKAYDNPMLLNNPTIFGYNPSTGSFMGGGDAPNKGAEVVSGASTLMNMVQNAVSTENGILQYYLERIMQMLAELLDGLPEWLNIQIVADDGTIIAYYSPLMDEELGKISKRKKRGH